VLQEVGADRVQQDHAGDLRGAADEHLRDTAMGLLVSVCWFAIILSIPLLQIVDLTPLLQGDPAGPETEEEAASPPAPLPEGEGSRKRKRKQPTPPRRR
jgi:hypothetical protein